MARLSGFLDTNNDQQFVTSTSLVKSPITDICDITLKNICNLQVFLYTDNPGQKCWDTQSFLPLNSKDNAPSPPLPHPNSMLKVHTILV
jgi:hypothetical protein